MALAVLADAFGIEEDIGAEALSLAEKGVKSELKVSKKQEEEDKLLELAAKRGYSTDRESARLHYLDSHLWYEKGGTFSDDILTNFQANNGTLQAWNASNIPASQNEGRHMSRGFLIVQVSVVSTLAFFFVLMLASELHAHKTEDWFRTFSFLWILDFFEFCMLLIWSIDTAYNDGRGAVVSNHGGTGFHVRQGRPQQQSVDELLHPQWNTHGKTERAVKLATGWIVLGAAIASQILIALNSDGSISVTGAALITPLIAGAVAAVALMVYLLVLRGMDVRKVNSVALEWNRTVQKALKRDPDRVRKQTNYKLLLQQDIMRYQDETQRTFWLSLGLLVLAVLILIFLSLLASHLSLEDGGVSHGIGSYYIVFIPVWIAVFLATVLWVMVCVVPWWVPIMDCGVLVLYFLALAGTAATTILLPLRLEETVNMSWAIVLLPLLISLTVIMLATCGFLLCRDLLHPPNPKWHILSNKKVAEHFLQERLTARPHNFDPTVISDARIAKGPGPVGNEIVPYNRGARTRADTNLTYELSKEQREEAEKDRQREENLRRCELYVYEQLQSDAGDRQYISALPLRAATNI